MELLPQRHGGDRRQLTGSYIGPVQQAGEPDEQPAPLSPTERVPPDAGVSSVAVRLLSEYEPPLVPHPAANLHLPADLSRPMAFQLALDLQWAHDHRAEYLETRIDSVEAKIARRLLSAAVEVLDGRRPLEHLDGHLTPMVYAAMETRTRQIQVMQGIRLHSVHLCQPAKGVIEACGTLSRGHRLQALAARLEQHRHGWLCAVLRLVQ